MKLKRTILKINVRETEWAIKSSWQHWIHKIQYEDKQNKIQHRKLYRTKIRGWTQLMAEGKQFLFLIRH